MKRNQLFLQPAPPNRFRRLLASELVRRSDFVADDHEELKPWEGLTGFRADAYVKAIYRRDERHSLAAVI